MSGVVDVRAVASGRLSPMAGVLGLAGVTQWLMSVPLMLACRHADGLWLVLSVGGGTWWVLAVLVALVHNASHLLTATANLPIL